MDGTRLSACPKCGAAAYLSKDTVHGNFMGYSVGCPRYCIDDGIHGVHSYEENKIHAYALHGFATKKAAVEAWERRCKND
jgi:hypothetical protein